MMRWLNSYKLKQARKGITNHIAPAKAYIGQNRKIVDKPSRARYSLPKPDVQYSLPSTPSDDQRLKEYLQKKRESPPFCSSVLQLIEKKQMTPKDFYSAAAFDRKLFSAIKNGGYSYQPSRNTAIRSCFALQLTLSEAEHLLKIAGFALSNASTSDLLISYCLEQGIWNLFDVDDLMMAFGQNSIFK